MSGRSLDLRATTALTAGIVLACGALLFLGGCAASPDGPEAGAPGAGSAEESRRLSLQEELDRQKGSTRRRMDGDEEPPPPPREEPRVPDAPSVPPQPAVVEPVEPSPEPAPAPPVGPPPEWRTSRRHPAYPSSEYLIGVGEASTRSLPGEASAEEVYREAWARAVADILAQFETRVTSEVTTFIQQSLETRSSDEQGWLLQAGTSRVKAQVDGSLQGVRPAERYFNPETGYACVLVALRRQDYAAQAIKDLQSIDGKVQELGRQAAELEREEKPYRAYRLFRETEELLVGRKTLAARALYAAPSAQLPAPPLTLTSVFSSRKKLAPRVRLVIAVEREAFGEPSASQPVEEQLVSGLSAYGFRVQLAPPGLAGLPARQLVSDLEAARAALGDGAGQSLLVVCKISSDGRATEADLLSVRSVGWARAFDLQRDELLATAVTPTGRDAKPAVGLEEQRSELAQTSAVDAARYLARLLYTRL